MATFSEPRTRAPRIPEGVVFEIVKTSTGYNSTPTVVVNFNGSR